MLVLPIVLGTLSLEHAMEMDHDVHEEHQCEMYDAIQNALSNPVEIDPALDNASCFHRFYTLQKKQNHSSSPYARAPPIFV
jgi:hypothetical protein